MKTNEYLDAVLQREQLAEDGPELEALRVEADKVKDIIEIAFDDCMPTIRYGGSKAKRTMVKSGYDLDLTVYFDHDDTGCGDTLKDIYLNVQDALSEHYHVVPKNSSLRLEVFNGDTNTYTHIDVVPGRFASDDENNDDVYLHQNEGEKNWLKTNLQKHIEVIRESGMRPEIKLAKIWRNKQGLNVKTFVLELVVIKILDGRKDYSLEDNLNYLWTTLRDSIDGMAIEDPANPKGNDLSEIFNQSKPALSSAAASALVMIDAGMWTALLGEAETSQKIHGLVPAPKATAAPAVGATTRAFVPSSPYGG